ncbi:unnamed protein product [Clonostachys rosea f. rosea IK726]|jgi:Cu2+-exporting ATPase|uniref:Uncharacterized protein n=1 Tax=Clonostachys rosea f. rosea IK726 TaxID=1349383 RepID=A0ACA9U082_BIOOC|nr:unnamed protein product [Clonostachys rosea f. rosea IK726]
MAVLVNNSGRDHRIGARLLQYGDQFRVLPHSRVPTDGKIIDGATEIDGSMPTREATPTLEKIDDLVVAGTINSDGTILVQLEHEA